MKSFNTTGLCNPDKHYMVDITEQTKQIAKMVEKGLYFTINRARQYGKTTTLAALESRLKEHYLVVFIDFQGIGNDSFKNEGTFSQALARVLMDACEFGSVEIPSRYMDAFENLNRLDTERVKLDDIFRIFLRWCRESEKPIVLMIDEVDSATNNQVFLDFLAQLRLQYLKREGNSKFITFQSVILAGVTDVRNLKRKLHPEEEHKFNSPWNIAADFKVDMSLHEDGIAGMLQEYEADHKTGMDVNGVAKEIYAYTNGYPFLVSRICQLIDTEIVGDERCGSLDTAWTCEGVFEAVRLILLEKNTLFDTLMGKVYDNQELRDTLERILLAGETLLYNPDDMQVADAEMYGFVQNAGGTVVVANRIFETRLYNFFLNTGERKNAPIYQSGIQEKDGLIVDGHLQMERLLRRFVECFDDIYGDRNEIFDEEEGRRRFLLYLRPIINGTGNYYIEAQTRNKERMDLVIDYLGERFVIELKIWRGKAYHQRGEIQLADYLDHYHLKKGYMLTYSFNRNKTVGIERIEIGDKELIEAMV